ncbi:hypothetical protein [Kitasatospora brasiliensis]|uniref:hypothetical protein n=1 Tax=Kitasatospora brasiliensis TaxID=3058040 RepID=UPI002930447B|nr:hypothetical protein [Kitasatospora sp. K002]
MTGDPLQVSLDQLRRSFDVLIRHIEGTTKDGTVALDEDYFWSIPSDELYDVTKEPATLTIGQLSESWQHMQDLLADEDRALGYHLVWLADVLRAIGQDLV